MNVSDTNTISIYHPGSYLIHPSDFNVMVWEIMDSEGNVIVEDTLWARAASHSAMRWR